MPNTIYLGAHFSCIKFSSFTLFFRFVFLLLFDFAATVDMVRYTYLFFCTRRANAKRIMKSENVYHTAENSRARPTESELFFFLFFFAES